MTDDRRKKRVDRRKINLGQEHEVRWWTAALGVTKTQLRAAVKAVGVEVKKVRAYLQGEPVKSVVKRGRKAAKKDKK